MSAQENPYNGQNINSINDNRQRSTLGVISLALGIAALATFMMFINVPLAIAAIVFGIMQIVGHSPKGYAWLGIIFAGLSIVLMIVSWGVIFKGMSNLSEDDMNRIRQEFEQQYENEINEEQL